MTKIARKKAARKKNTCPECGSLVKDKSKEDTYTFLDIMDSLCSVDFGVAELFPDFTKNELFLDSDTKGNDKGPFIYLKVYKTFVKINGGFELTVQERQTRFVFKHYSSLESLTESIAKFTRKYFESFRLTRIKSKK